MARKTPIPTNPHLQPELGARGLRRELLSVKPSTLKNAPQSLDAGSWRGLPKGFNKIQRQAFQKPEKMAELLKTKMSRASAVGQKGKIGKAFAGRMGDTFKGYPKWLKDILRNPKVTGEFAPGNPELSAYAGIIKKILNMVENRPKGGAYASRSTPKTGGTRGSGQAVYPSE